jgi:hypothetical protein
MDTIKKGLPSLLLSLLLGIIAFGIGNLGVDEKISTLIATIVVIVSLVVFLVIYRTLLRKITISFLKDELKTTDEKGTKFKHTIKDMVAPNEVTQKADFPDIVKIYSSFSECENKIIEDIKNAHTVKLFTNIGRDDLTKGNKFYDALIQNSQHAEFQYLIADVKSHFVSEGWAVKQNNTKDEAFERSRIWVERINQVVSDAKLIKTRYHVNIKIKGHRYPFLWHFWIIDDRAYISAFLKPTRNYFTVQVYELKRLTNNPDNGLFEMFNTFFDRVWEEQSYEFGE